MWTGMREDSIYRMISAHIAGGLTIVGVYVRIFCESTKSVTTTTKIAKHDEQKEKKRKEENEFQKRKEISRVC